MESPNIYRKSLIVFFLIFSCLGISHYLTPLAYADGNTTIQTSPHGLTYNQQLAAYDSMGIQATKFGKYSTAEFDFRQALSIAPTNPTILNNLGLTLDLEGRVAEAISYYNQAIYYEPNYQNAIHNRALAEQELNQANNSPGNSYGGGGYGYNGGYSR